MKLATGEYLGTYCGLVVDTTDPLRLGRVKVRVPVLHGMYDGPIGLVEDQDLPWFLPAGLPAGGTQESGGVSWIPVPGDQVWVRFLDGDLTKPVWEWGNQYLGQIPNYGTLPLHEYDPKLGIAARRAALTRYWHWMELLPTGLDLWTKSNYHFEIYDEQVPNQPSGRLTWTTALGYALSLDDSIETLETLVPHVEINCLTHDTNAAEQASLTTPLAVVNFGQIELGGDYQMFEIDATRRTERGLRASLQNLGLEAARQILISCPSLQITSTGLQFNSDTNDATTNVDDIGFSVSGAQVKLGRKADDPVVRLSDLEAALRVVKQVFDSHVHVNAGGNGNSGPPSTPAQYVASGSADTVVEPSSKQVKAIQ